MDWGVFFTTVTSNVVVAGALVYLAKELAKLLIARDTERFKAQLERENLEHEIRFRRVDEKIAEQLSAVYEVLYTLVDALRVYLHPASDMDQGRMAFVEACKQFDNTFFAHVFTFRLISSRRWSVCTGT